jgi:enoyl-CoA hydratase/carnithine racemase
MSQVSVSRPPGTDDTGTPTANPHVVAVIDASATIELPEVILGPFQTAGAALPLTQSASRRAAPELALTRPESSAAESEHWGLVSTVSAEGESLEAAARLAEGMGAENCPMAERTTIRLLRCTALLLTGRQAWEVNSDKEAGPVFAGDDSRERALTVAKRCAATGTRS